MSKKNKPSALYRVINGALIDAINKHGDITKGNVSSATKRVEGAVRGLEKRSQNKDAFWAWIDEGMRLGFCSNIVCNTHEGLPSTEEEDAQWDEGYDPCVLAVRLTYLDG